MAVTAVGFTGTVNELQWAQLMSRAAPMSVDSGDLVPSAATGTRLVDVAAGDAWAAGVLATNSASATVTLNANGSSNDRYDIVVLKIDWAADTVSLDKVTGTAAANPSPPSLTYDPGTLVHVPLAQVKVKSGATQLATADVVDIRPVPFNLKLYTPAVSATNVGASAGAKVIATRVIPDPGVAYRIRVSGAVRFNNVASGHGIIRALVDGVELTSGHAATGNDSSAVLRTEVTNALTGSHTVTLTMEATGMSEQLTSLSSTSTGFTLEVVPV